MKAINNYNLEEKLINDSVFVIGNVFGVKGKDIIVKINKDKNLPHLFFKGRAIKNVSVGLSNYIKILKGFTEIICKVEGEYLEEDKFQTNKEYTSERQRIDRFLNVSVFGFYDHDGKFQHGIKEMPLIGSECRLLSRDEFENLHQLSDNNELSIKLGSLIDEEIQEIRIAAGKLFSGHIGIFGNTGSGKSNTLARIYTELFNSESLKDDFVKKSRFIIIDFNGEYSKERDDQILTDKKIVYKLRTRDNKGDKYPIAKTEIEKLELLSILLDATEKTQQPFLHRAIDTSWFSKNNNNYEKEVKSITQKLKIILSKKDKNFNVPFLRKFVKDFESIGFQLVNAGKSVDDLKYNATTSGFYYGPRASAVYFENNESNFIGDSGYFKVAAPKKLRDLQKIQFKILDQYYYELLDGYINQEHIGPLMGRLKKRFDMLNKVVKAQSRIVKNHKNVRVIDLKNVNLEIKKVLPLLICKSSYDEQKKRRDKERENSLHIVIDEAHNILSESSTRESDSWKDYRLETFEEIIKEGRKFGVFLTVASQRPADISPTIISQLHNYFIHRLMNENDLRSINKAVSYLDKLSFDSISNLSVGCCFIAGHMTQFPLSVKVLLLEPNKRPQSETVNLDKLWNKNYITS
ncbi:conserved hypothetical protein [Candidatus Zixiibacteriota bacterium]|nr:conserved hypothetical protein [candidate division Zixibacteria bacterium]